jgi:hypothetical protein
VTKGGRGNVQNPESQANPATGSNAVQGYQGNRLKVGAIPKERDV